MMNWFVVAGAGGALFAILVLATQYGFKSAQAAAKGEKDEPALGAIDGAVFALLGLLLAFSFSASANRFQMRRDLVVNEANAIGTAQLRLDLLSTGAHATTRPMFDDYIQSRLDYSKALGGNGSIEETFGTTLRLQSKLWNMVVADTDPLASSPRAMLLLPALNDMFDAASARHVATRAHMPLVIVYLLVGLSVLSAFMAGRTVAKFRVTLWQRSIYALVLTMTLLVIADLDYPRLGLIRLDYSDELMVGLKEP